MPTDYGDVPAPIVKAFEDAFPVSTDAGVLEEIAALEKLFGREMPEELSRMIELDRHEALSPTPRDLVREEKPFEALILRAQEMNDCVPLLFPLTNVVYLRRFEGWADLLCNVLNAADQPARPFVGWRQGAWAADMPSFLRVAAARTAYNEERDDAIEELLAPVWGRLGRNDHLADLFAFVEQQGIAARLDAAWGDRPRFGERLSLFWRHERALFFGFALMGKYRHPEKGAFDNDPAPILANADFLRNLGGQIETLCRAWFLESDDFLSRALAATANSPSLLVRDAHRLFTELRAGRRTVGSVDLHDARDSYKLWIKDEEAYRRHQRSVRRAELEAKLAPSEHGIALVRADWPLAGKVATTPEPPPARSVTWNGQALELTVDDATKTLPKPPESTGLFLGLMNAKYTLSPSGKRLVVDATQNRATKDGKSRENAQVLAEHDLEVGTWRVLTDAAGGAWYAAFEEDRWIYRDANTVYLLRDTGETFADATYTAPFGQPKSFCIPELGVLFAYGSLDLANGRPVDDRGAPWVRVIGFWRDRVGQIASFAIDAEDVVAEKVDGKWRVGLVSGDRAVGWELRGLEAGVEAWRRASQETEAAERAKREAFGEITIHNAIDAVNTFIGTRYAPEIQDGVTKVYDKMLDGLRADEAIVRAAKDAKQALDFVDHVKGPFAKGLMESGLGPVFVNFAVEATMLNPKVADVIVRAATTSAWKALREG